MIKTLKHNLVLKLDLIGFSASTICAIHCAAMPFIIVFLPLIGLQFIANPIVEYAFISSSIIIGSYTFKHGYLNHHRKIYPFAIFLIGITIILIGHFAFHDHSRSLNLSAEEKHSYEIAFLLVAPFGALLIGASHFLNRKLSKKCKNTSCDQQQFENFTLQNADKKIYTNPLVNNLNQSE